MASGKFSTVINSISAPTTRAPSVMFFSVVVPALVQSPGAVHILQGRSIGETEVGLAHDLLAVVERGGSEVTTDLGIPALGPGGVAEQHVDLAGGEHVETLGGGWCPRTRRHWRRRARPRQERGSSQRRIPCRNRRPGVRRNRWRWSTRRNAGCLGPGTSASVPPCVGLTTTSSGASVVAAAAVVVGSWADSVVAAGSSSPPHAVTTNANATNSGASLRLIVITPFGSCFFGAIPTSQGSWLMLRRTLEVLSHHRGDPSGVQPVAGEKLINFTMRQVCCRDSHRHNRGCSGLADLLVDRLPDPAGA